MNTNKFNHECEKRTIHPSIVLENDNIQQALKVDPLIEEAKKYDSAEEFIEAQGAPVYHGSTDPEGIKEFKEKSFRYNGIYLTADRKYAKFFAGSEGKIEEVKYDIKNPLKINLPDGNGRIRGSIIIDNKLIPSYRELSKENIELLKNKGYDGIEVKVDSNYLSGKFKGKAVNPFEIVVFDPSKVKTKQQLTDIWNKAQEGQDRIDQLVLQLLNEEF